MLRKTIFLVACCVVVLGLQAQSYTITGKVGKGNKWAYFKNMESETVDSVAVDEEGQFRFDGVHQEQYFATVSDGKKTVPVVLDGAVNIDFTTMTITGTRENRMLDAVNKKIQPMVDSIMKIVPQLRKIKQDTPEFKRLFARYNKHKEHIYEIVRMSVYENKPAFFFPAVLLSQYYEAYSETELRGLFREDNNIKNLSLLSSLKKQALASEKRTEGQRYTDFKMYDDKGMVKSLSDFVGNNKYVLVDFWASWCGPCRKEMPQVKALYDRYHDKGFDIVGVSFDQNKEQWLAAIKQLKATWHHLSDLKGWQNEAGEIYGIKSLPFTMLIDPNGVIVGVNLRGESLAEKLRVLFGEDKKELFQEEMVQ